MAPGSRGSSVTPEILLVLLVVAVAVLLIVGPLRLRHTSFEAPRSPERAELEAAKEAKYREIRDAELDFRTGKLSREDWRILDSALRAEAIEILRRIDAVEDEEDDAQPLPENERRP